VRTLRVGMSQEEAVAVLRTYNPDIIDGVYARGKTRRGVSWSGTNLVGETIADLPPPQEVEQCVLEISDDSGREIEVILGSGGIVSGKRLSPGVWQYRLDEVRRVLTRAAADIVSGSWWREQARKASRSVYRRRRYAVPCLAAVLLLVSACVLRRRIGRY